MKIALVSEHANPLADLGGPDAGGQNVYVASLARQLGRLGHEVTVFTRRDSVSLPDRVAAHGYMVEHLTAGPQAPLAKDRLLRHMPEFAEGLYRRFEAERFDLVHAHFWMSGLASVSAAEPLGIPVVQTFHALGTVKRRQQGAKDTSPLRRIDLESRLCRKVDHVIATCTDEVWELRRMGLPMAKVSVIPCGVDTALFRPLGGPTKERSIAVVGRLVERKGVGNVIEALAEVPDTRLLIAGGPERRRLEDDPEVRRLTRIAEELGVRDRVTFLGSVPQSEVPRLMAEANAVVCAPWYEPFGIVPVEAMACGRPVVGTAVGGLLDTVDPGSTGELVPPRRPDLLARALRELLDDPERCAGYGATGRRKAVRHYRWRQVAVRVASVYSSLLQASPSADLAEAEARLEAVS